MYNNVDMILVTGAAGFIGFHVAKRILESDADASIIGIDNLNDYYDVNLKHKRLEILEGFKNFSFKKIDLADKNAVDELFVQYKPSIIIHLGAQAGVRYSIENPQAYLDSNIVGTFNILEGARQVMPELLVYASSSSVYGNTNQAPFSVEDKTDYPVSFYAATKKANEVMAYSYAKLYNITTIGLRFFTVYGPWGRPDMAYFKFAEKMINNAPIELYNSGDMLRDFTYVDDIVDCIVKIIKKKPKFRGGDAPCKVYNIGNNKPEKLLDFVDTLEALMLEHKLIDKPSNRVLLSMQDGDVMMTHADTAEIEKDFDFKPDTPIKVGLTKFVEWFKQYKYGQK